MERVKEFIWVETQKRNTKVQHIVLESTILQKKVDVEKVGLNLSIEIAIVCLTFTHIELFGVWSLHHQDQVGLLNWHLFDWETLLVVHNLDFGFHCFVVDTPALLRH